MSSPVHRLSACNIRSVHPTRAIEIFGNVLRSLVPRPSVDNQAKFYGDYPRGTHWVLKPKRGRQIFQRYLLLIYRLSFTYRYFLFVMLGFQLTVNTGGPMSVAQFMREFSVFCSTCVMSSLKKFSSLFVIC